VLGLGLSPLMTNFPWHFLRTRNWSSLRRFLPSIVSQHYVVYKLACDLCGADYVGYTARHLHQRIAEHKYSAIGKHLLEGHGS